MSNSDTIVIRLGDSGDGVQLVGEQLTITVALTRMSEHFPISLQKLEHLQ